MGLGPRALEQGIVDLKINRLRLQRTDQLIHLRQSRLEVGLAP